MTREAKVLTVTYEATGEGVSLMKSHFAEVAAVHGAGFEMADKYGATGFRPGRDGKPRTFIFDAVDAPKGFVRVGTVAPGRIECKPHKGTSVGKRAEADMVAVPTAPDDHKLASRFGYSPSSYPMDGTSIYFPTHVRTAHPEARYFLRLPRLDDDGFICPDTLAEVPESEMMRAIEAHNAEAKRLRLIGGVTEQASA